MSCTIIAVICLVLIIRDGKKEDLGAAAQRLERVGFSLHFAIHFL